VGKNKIIHGEISAEISILPLTKRGKNGKIRGRVIL